MANDPAKDRYDRKSGDNFAFDIKERVEIQFEARDKVYVKS